MIWLPPLLPLPCHPRRHFTTAGTPRGRTDYGSLTTVHGYGGVIAVMYETHCAKLLSPFREWELLQSFNSPGATFSSTCLTRLKHKTDTQTASKDRYASALRNENYRGHAADFSSPTAPLLGRCSVSKGMRGQWSND